MRACRGRRGAALVAHGRSFIRVVMATEFVYAAGARSCVLLSLDRRSASIWAGGECVHAGEFLPHASEPARRLLQSERRKGLLLRARLPPSGGQRFHHCARSLATNVSFYALARPHTGAPRWFSAAVPGCGKLMPARASIRRRSAHQRRRCVCVSSEPNRTTTDGW